MTGAWWSPPGPVPVKTYVLVQKYIDLLKTRGVSVPQILALTFTDKAAAEMKDRIRKEDPPA